MSVGHLLSVLRNAAFSSIDTFLQICYTCSHQRKVDYLITFKMYNLHSHFLSAVETCGCIQGQSVCVTFHVFRAVKNRLDWVTGNMDICYFSLTIGPQKICLSFFTNYAI